MSHSGSTHLPNKSGPDTEPRESAESRNTVEPGPDMDSDEFDAKVYEVAARLAMEQRR